MTDQPQTTESVEVIQLLSAASPRPLNADALRWRCDPESLPFESTAHLEPVEGVVGQDSAVESLRFGLEVHAPGQNVFVRGLTGTGRLTLVWKMVQNTRPACAPARDRCYVHNFAQPSRPRLITLPPGQAPAFRKAIDDLADFIRNDLASALNAPTFLSRKAVIDREAQQQIESVVGPFEAALKEDDLALVTVAVGPVAQAALFPIIDGKPVAPEQWQELRREGRISDEQAARFRQKHDAAQEQLSAVMEQVNAIRSRQIEAVSKLGEDELREILEAFVANFRTQFSDPAVNVFLDEVIHDAATRGARQRDDESKGDPTYRYRVNVLITRSERDGCEVVVECAPSLSNLLGVIERRFDHEWVGRSDHMMIRAGSLLRADGGYLVLDAREVLSEPGAWKVLIRTLKTGKLEIVPPEMSFSWLGPALQPEPIDVDVKVILIGDADIYYLLDEYDPDFPHLFKVLADFDSLIPRTPDNILNYARVLARIAREEGLIPFHKTAVAALVEHGARIAGRGARLTARFGRLADLAREAAFIAGKASERITRGEHVKQAVARTKRRADLPSRRFREYIADGTIRIAVTGRAVGQINGLAVLQAGQLTYGFPSRITATIGPGSAGVVNIEREAELSGSIHTKGFYILGGLLRYLLRTQHPLAFHASIAFEQSYGGIDGDSASCAEMCCLLSALTDVPIRQDLAMTGAIDQVGNVLAVGACNEKIEGFFDACRDLGLTGTQGVVIPLANAPDLMLREDVVEACRQEQFHIYTVSTIHEAIELFTGVVAGRQQDDGFYPDNTLLGLAVNRAYEYWLQASQSGNGLAAQSQEADAGGNGRAPSPPPLLADD